MNFSFSYKFLVLILGAVTLLWQCSPDANQDRNAEKAEQLFELVDPKESGVDFINTLESNPRTSRNNMNFDFYYNGAGVAVGDVNNDGLPDIFFAANENKNRLYLNEGDFKFKDV